MVELWILLTLVAAGIAFALFNRLVRRRKAEKESDEKHIYPLW